MSTGIFPEEIWRLILSAMSLTNTIQFRLVSKPFSIFAYECVESFNEYTHEPILNDKIISRFTHIKHIVLQRDMSQITEKGIQNMSQLLSLSMGSKIKYLPPVMPSITRLDIQKNLFITDEHLSKLTTLEHLGIYGNSPIFGVRVNILTNITSLILNSGTSFTSGFLQKMTNLTSLDLAYCVGIYDSGLSGLTNLTYLNLTDMTTIMGQNLTQLHLLTQLDLSYNVGVTNDVVRKLTNLQALFLWGNNIITDNTIGKLTGLTHLNIGRNHMITDNTISKLTKLTHLNIYENATITVDGINMLTNLIRIQCWSTSRHITREVLENLTYYSQLINS